MERKKKKLIYNVVVSLLLITGLVWVCSISFISAM